MHITLDLQRKGQDANLPPPDWGELRGATGKCQQKIGARQESFRSFREKLRGPSSKIETCFLDSNPAYRLCVSFPGSAM